MCFAAFFHPTLLVCASVNKKDSSSASNPATICSMSTIPWHLRPTELDVSQEPRGSSRFSIGPMLKKAFALGPPTRILGFGGLNRDSGLISIRATATSHLQSGSSRCSRLWPSGLSSECSLPTTNSHCRQSSDALLLAQDSRKQGSHCTCQTPLTVTTTFNDEKPRFLATFQGFPRWSTTDHGRSRKRSYIPAKSHHIENKNHHHQEEQEAVEPREVVVVEGEDEGGGGGGDVTRELFFQASIWRSRPTRSSLIDNQIIVQKVCHPPEKKAPRVGHPLLSWLHRGHCESPWTTSTPPSLVGRRPFHSPRDFSDPHFGRLSTMSSQSSSRTLGNGVHGSPSSPKTADRLGLLALSKTFNRFYYGGFQTKECRPLFCQNTQIGLIRKDVFEELRRFEDVFDFSRDDRVSIRDDLDSFESRTQAVDGVLRKLRDECDFAALRGWRDETYDIRPNFSQEPLLKMERAATCMLGLRQYGIDINGYVNHSVEGLCLWLQKRSARKPTWPGMWDNFVSGGLSTGFGIAETAVKEAQEEANVSPDLAKTMKPGGVVTFFFESERGIFPQTEFVFDLELPEDFTPENNDGEVEGFELVPVHRIFERLLSPEMKTTSCPVTIDFLVRRGIINSENEPNLPQLVENLHIPIHSCYQ